MRQLTRYAVAIVLVFALAACSQAPKDDEKKAEGSTPEQTTEAKKIKAGFIYVSPVGDAGYSYAHDLGRKAVADLGWVETAFVESVPEGTDSERVIRNMARKDFDIVFATSFGYMDPALKVAKEYPNIKFMHCSGFKKSDNMNNYFGRMYQARYLTGMVAGAMTKSNVVGYVAAFPIPEVIRGINAFALGVRAENPNAEIRVVWTKTWYDPALEKDAAISLLDVGADVIAQHQDSPGPQEAAQERGVYSVGYNSNMATFAPKAHLTAAVWNWAPLYVEAVKQVKEGSWKGNQSIWWGIEKGIVDIAPYGEMVPEAVRNRVDAKKAEIKKAAFAVFAGPIENQKGDVVIPEGQVATDEQLLGMTWFVNGVIGTTE